MKKAVLLLTLFAMLLTGNVVTAAPPSQTPDGEAYVVQPGDWLTKIAEKFYGDANAYRVIVEATNAKAAEDASFAVIDNPSLIRVGQKLWIPAQPVAGEGELTLEALQNASYQGIYDEPVQLTDGRYEGEPFVPGGASRPTVVLQPEAYAFGDLNGDGVDDAAVILIENSGGSGSFIYLAAVINVGGAPVNVATQLVGDREQVQAISIDGNEITVHMVTHGPNDPMCCPTQEVTKRYRLQGDQLVEVIMPLEGTLWTLVSYGDPSAPQAVLEGSEITAEFDSAEGTVSGSAGCNSYFGSYEVDGETITFGLLGSTLMACLEPEGIMDQEQAYLAALASVATYHIQGDKLEIRDADGALVLQFTAKPTEVAAGEAYIVQPGDWLLKIAEKFYGDADAYRVIVEATNAKAAEDASFTVIDDPNLIRAGQKLWIPAQPGTAEGELTLETLQNAVYQGIYDEPVQLTDGKYEGEPFVPGGASRPTVTFHPEVYAFGDLNGDGVDDAAVILIENSGGSGSFIYLAAVINDGGTPVNVATHLVGDREQVQAISIEEGEITLNMVAHAPDDPMCCPTQEVTKQYRLQGDQLVEL
jgi:heat shock protein HslJ/LysM repeat protein